MGRNLLDLGDGEVSGLAKTLQASLKALRGVVGDVPYNFGFHQSTDSEAAGFFHWHLEVYPKLSIWAGFEINTGTYINTVTPEAAAESLRGAMQAGT